ncbi:fumarylacetoacetate hydrolase family protein [Haloechinothrix sp. LS1_15]|uniref:fumarylacetoacetate hydrolase family protein n=1 Tax=Haloechinothrix sp. LS1_15 TaxID=2652248 RepID=UPI002944F316|nr:fumarylacetoacetate hydrolase family protein [Haloechinothrix sp. LS1_15]MDV6013506.1 fumarylacetoacetate hydrolase family protein [Haloechinothrix sp. LS1_15]
MRLARIAHPDGVAFASLEGDVDGDEATVHEIAEHPFGTPSHTGRSWPLAEVRLLAPILPTKIIAVGKNYAEHAAEFGSEVPESPVIFMKPSTSVTGPNTPIKMPASSERVDFEGELAVVIGRPVKNVPASKAAAVVRGYTIANDVTARDQQRADGQWTRAKGYDTFCPLGPWIATDIDPADLEISTEVDGEVKQASHTAKMVHTVGELIEFVSHIMTLLPGDVILTGTPEGVGPLTEGSNVTVTVSGIGSLSNPVQADSD